MKKLLLAAAALGLSASAAGAQTITTVPAWNGSNFINAWGGGSTNTYGEVIDAPGTSLDSFTFYVNDQGTAANYVAQVYNWVGDNVSGQPVGSAIYTGPNATIAPGEDFQAVTVDTGGVATVAGNRYDILLFDGSNDGVEATWGLTGFGTHPGVAGDVGFAFSNGPSNVNGTFEDFGSLAYTATFSNGAAVPEPATWAMMLVGFGMVGFGLRTTRKQSARVTFA